MDNTTKIKDIMTTQVITVNPNDTIAVVREKITDNSIHHIPVVEDGKVEGMISLNDIHRMEHHFTQFNNPEAEASNDQLFASMLAKEIMSTPVFKVNQNAELRAAVDIFLENKFHALAVVDEHEDLVGMITTFDVIKHSIPPKN